MPQGGVKRSQLRFAQPRCIRFGIVETEVEQVGLPALVHIRMRYDYIVHGDYLEAEKTSGGESGDMVARPYCFHDLNHLDIRTKPVEPRAGLPNCRARFWPLTARRERHKTIHCCRWR
ncbi:hypothetical protein D3C76_1625220 [compost metagenome]